MTPESDELSRDDLGDLLIPGESLGHLDVFGPVVAAHLGALHVDRHRLGGKVHFESNAGGGGRMLVSLVKGITSAKGNGVHGVFNKGR